MREVNYSFVSQGKASVGVTSGLYDRRALDCTSTLPLINSLTHLSYLTSSSARIREILTVDGGVERLACILKGSRGHDILSTWKWTLAFQCLVNIGVRGSEQIRTRVVEADMVPIVATILDNFLHTLDQIKVDNQQQPHQHRRSVSRCVSLTGRDAETARSFAPAGSLALHARETDSISPHLLPARPASPVTPLHSTSPSRHRNERPDASRLAHQSNNDSDDAFEAPPAPVLQAARGLEPILIDAVLAESEQAVLSRLGESDRPAAGDVSETFAITHHPPIDGSANNDSTLSPHLSPQMASPPLTAPPSAHAVPDSNMLLLPREEDVVLSLQLLAYVSKYPHLRQYFQHSHLVKALSVKYGIYDYENEYVDLPELNMFPLVEKFTIRHHPQEMQYWAGVIMRNSCRKDDARGGIRQCAYFACGKWEEFPRQFAKCRRCRRTKYCSKACQSSAWSHHRFWCVQTTY